MTPAPDPDIIYQDPTLVAVHKPSGLLSVPGRTEPDCVLTRLKSMLGISECFAAHRIDMDTSGIMLVALKKFGESELSKQFQARTIKKTYVAWVDGMPEPRAGLIDLPHRLDVDNRPYQIVDHEQGKPAQTGYTVDRVENGRARVRFEPKTGRTHQLRVHAAFGLHCPILGDRLYGDVNAAPRLMLHALDIEFTHPITEDRMFLEAPAPF